MAEVWEDLQCAGFGIYRDTEGFSYGHDAVLLANFVRATRNDHVLDLGAGTGIVSFLVHAKTGAGICAADISERCCRLMEKSVAKNGLSKAIKVYEADLRLLPDARLPWESFDCICCNPPYFSGGTESPNPVRRRMLKNGGRLFACYPVLGLSRFCAALEAEKLAVKRICFVRSKCGKAPYLFLAEAKKGGKSGLVFEADIILEES